MPYVSRDGARNITGLHAQLQPGRAEEYLEETDPEVIAIRNPTYTTDERITRAFTNADFALAMFESLFDLTNVVRDLKAQAPLTRAQFRTSLGTKLVP